ncbi:MAG: alpha/beta hydrolase [Planctomycetota bacterium]
MLDCASGISRARKAQLDADPAVSVLGDINQLYRASCPVWNVDLGEDFRENFDTEIPTLLVHGTWDVSTPLENARELAPHFKNGKLVLVNGGSHSAMHEAVKASLAFQVGFVKFLQSGDLSALPDEVDLPEIDWKTPE